MTRYGQPEGERGGPSRPPWLAPGHAGGEWRRSRHRATEAASTANGEDDGEGRHSRPEVPADDVDAQGPRDERPAELDEIEARAARLLEQVARRSQQEGPTPELPGDAEPDHGRNDGPAWEPQPRNDAPPEPQPRNDAPPPPQPRNDAPPAPHATMPLSPGWPAAVPPGVLPPPPPWMLPPPPPGWAPGPPPGAPAGPVPSPAAPPQGFQPPRTYWGPPPLDDPVGTRRNRVAPQRGWRRAIHKMTGGYVNPGDSRKDRERAELMAQIQQPFVGDFRIAVLSIKGGVGKTTTTLGLGSALAMVRGDRVIAVDANPDRGTLAERVLDQSTTSTVRDLLRDPNIRRYADVRNHTRMAISRLEVLASEQDPAVAEVFGETDYRRTVDILRHYYNIILTDCGTGIMHSAMAGVLDLAHTIVLVSSPAIDAARSASATLDWLEQHGHGGLVREAHVVFSAARPGSVEVAIDKLREHFAARCRSTHLIPFDQHLAEGAEIDFALLEPTTMQAYLGLAGAVAEKFARLHSPYER